MKKEIADAWIAALRDPGAGQCRGFLELTDGRQCCLGVLCRVMGVEGIPKITDDVVSFDGEIGELPISVRNKAEIRTRTGRIEALETDLATLNDYGLTFPEIADIIGEHWESL